MNHCDKKRLIEYLDGRLDVGTAADVQAHLSDCRICRDRVTDYKTLGTMIRSLEPVRPPEDLFQRISYQIRTSRSSASRPIAKRLGLAMAGVAALAVLIVVLSQPGLGQEPDPPRPVVSFRAGDLMPVDVPNQAIIELDFADEIDHVAIRESLRITPPIAADIYWFENTLRIHPTQPLSPDTIYRVEANAVLGSQAGDPLHLFVAFQTAPWSGASARAAAVAAQQAREPTSAQDPVVPVAVSASALNLPAAVTQPDPPTDLPSDPAVVSLPPTALVADDPPPSPTITPLPSPEATRPPSDSESTFKDPDPTSTPPPAAVTASDVNDDEDDRDDDDGDKDPSDCDTDDDEQIRNLRLSDSAADRLGCFIGTTRAVGRIQSFERGRMLTGVVSGEILVLGHGGSWLRQPNTWHEGDESDDDDEAAPEGLFAPVRGFGNLWRSQSAVRQLLGWGSEDDRDLELDVYQFTNGLVVEVGDRPLVIVNDGSWFAAR